MGFYKLNNEKSGLLYAERYVKNSVKTIVDINKKDSYSYPVDGWCWFDSEDEAYSFFGIEKPIIEYE